MPAGGKVNPAVMYTAHGWQNLLDRAAGARVAGNQQRRGLTRFRTGRLSVDIMIRKDLNSPNCISVLSLSQMSRGLAGSK